MKNLLDTIRVYVMSVNPIIGEEKLDELANEFWPVQPEPGSVADQLLKKGQDRGEKIGEARGEARGLSRGLVLEKSQHDTHVAIDPWCCSSIQ